MEKFVECWRLAKHYGSNGRTAVVVEDFALTIAEGEFVCLIGHSGCGKSTVLAMVAGLVEPTAGAIVVAGREIDGPGPDRGMVFQAPCLLPWMSALENVQLGVDRALRGRPERERRERALRALCRVGLGDAIDRRPGELSGGMKQRVGIARAFALEPRVMLLDEPFGMLDQLSRMELQDVLLDLWQADGAAPASEAAHAHGRKLTGPRKLTGLMVTHDVDEALLLADRVAMMTSGPAARLGKILEVPFPRPRNRAEVLEHPDFYRLREDLIGFLEDQARPERGAAAAA